MMVGRGEEAARHGRVTARRRRKGEDAGKGVVKFGK